jgi:hypothetical protein
LEMVMVIKRVITLFIYWDRGLILPRLELNSWPLNTILWGIVMPQQNRKNKKGASQCPVHRSEE